MNSFIRVMPVILACIATPAFASDDPPAAPASVEAAKSAPETPTASPATTATTASSTAPAKGQKLVLEDKTLTNVEVQRLLSQGYKPQKGKDDTVLYCRSEPQMGTHFEKKVCMSADQIKATNQDSQELVRKFQQNQGSSGK